MASSVHNNRNATSKFCGCWRTCHMWCWKGFQWLPVLLIVSIITWSYYAYVYQLCFITINCTIQKWVYLVLYHILLFMFAWSYWRTIFANIEQIPSKYFLTGAELEKLLSVDTEDGQRTIIENFAKDLPIVTREDAKQQVAQMMISNNQRPQTSTTPKGLQVHFQPLRNEVVTALRKYSKNFCKTETKEEILEKFISDLPILTRTMAGSVRYCNRCLLVKPDRAHHCSICSRCVLKMDHHCPWVNNCVCFQNYKFFMLFLGYALLYCLFIMSTCLPFFIKFWKGENASAATGSSGRYHIVFAFFVALMFAISLGSLFGYHCYLVIHNRTTLDMLLYSRRMGSPTGFAMIKTIVDEAFRPPVFRGGADKNGFSLGAFNNFKEVFGKSPKLWALPVFTSFGEGVVFPLPRDAEDEDTESLLSSERWDRWGERARPFDEPDGSSIDEL